MADVMRPDQGAGERGLVECYKIQRSRSSHHLQRGHQQSCDGVPPARGPASPVYLAELGGVDMEGTDCVWPGTGNYVP